MTNFYRIILQYKGTRYRGWQIQPTQSGPTIQGTLNQAIIQISKSEEIRTLGAGRTDAGVHALGQVVKISMPLKISPEHLVPALNVHLPEDIRVISSFDSTEDFLPTTHAHSKEYHYRFTSNKSFTAFQNELIQNYPFELNISKMQEACEILVGRHDFTNYFCEGTEVSSYIREIYQCQIKFIEQADSMLPPHYVFIIVGNGFLKQMVRLLMGAIWNVGRGKISLKDFKESLSSEKKPRLGAVAPPHGLYLVRVIYSGL